MVFSQQLYNVTFEVEQTEWEEAYDLVMARAEGLMM